mmetsp:Transcript_5084/g.7228  ORF Transcript_5084/g.7228 Transcript_5084/m.7228 type:complete len:292 (-) Transcript_5084:227-1102(-)
MGTPHAGLPARQHHRLPRRGHLPRGRELRRVQRPRPEGRLHLLRGLPPGPLPRRPRRVPGRLHGPQRPRPLHVQRHCHCAQGCRSDLVLPRRPPRARRPPRPLLCGALPLRVRRRVPELLRPAGPVREPRREARAGRAVRPQVPLRKVPRRHQQVPLLLPVRQAHHRHPPMGRSVLPPPKRPHPPALRQVLLRPGLRPPRQNHRHPPSGGRPLQRHPLPAVLPCWHCQPALRRCSSCRFQVLRQRRRHRHHRVRLLLPVHRRPRADQRRRARQQQRHRQRMDQQQCLPLRR